MSPFLLFFLFDHYFSNTSFHHFIPFFFPSLFNTGFLVVSNLCFGEYAYRSAC